MTKKILFSIIVLILCCFVSVSSVNASVFNANVQYKLEDKCVDNSVFGDPNVEGTTAHFLDEIFNAIKWLAPVLCIVFSIIEFVKAATSQDKEALNKAFSKTITRVVFTLVLFFLPTLINFFFPLIGWYGTCGIS